MSRIYALATAASLLLLSAPVALAQTADAIDVNVAGLNFSFPDHYEFQHGSNSFTGVLKTGGISFTAMKTIYEQVQETKYREVRVVRIVNGRPVIEIQQVPYTVTRNIPKTVPFQITLPAVNGTWYALGDPSTAVWVINSVNSSGIVVGVGFRHGQTVNGTVTYVLTTAPPTGVYQVTTAPAAPAAAPNDAAPAGTPAN